MMGSEHLHIQHINFNAPDFEGIGINHGIVRGELFSDATVTEIDENLPIAHGAAYNSYINQQRGGCLEGTRVDVLLQIKEWVDSPKSEAFWLTGRPGAGTTTLALSVAKWLDENGLLGASFFFMKGGGDLANVRKLFPTIAKQLARSIPQLIPVIKKAIFENPDIETRSITEQFHKLILLPLSGLDRPVHRIRTKIILIDGLDECGTVDDIDLIVQLLSDYWLSRDLPLRLFVTGWHDVSTRKRFEQLPHPLLNLSDIPMSTIWHDLALFFENRLSAVKDKYHLPDTWPGDRVIEALVGFSLPSFATATTICKDFEDSHSVSMDDPEKILRRLSKESKQYYQIQLPGLGQSKKQDNIEILENPELEAQSNSDNSNGGDTDIESVVSANSETSRFSSQPYVGSRRVSDLAFLLVQDEELVALCSKAIKKLRPARFRRNFARMLQRYSRSLFAEASGEDQREAAYFLQLSAQQIALRVYLILTKTTVNSYELKGFNMDSSEDIHIAMLESMIRKVPELSHNWHDPSMLSGSYYAAKISDDPDIEVDDPNSVITFNNARGFLTDGQSFRDLLEELQHWLEGTKKGSNDPESEKAEIDSNGAALKVCDKELESSVVSQKTRTQWPASYKSIVRMVFASRYISWFRKITRPKPKLGYRRIEWKCDCGVDLYADFYNSDRRQLDELAFSLRNPGQPNNAHNYEPCTALSKDLIAREAIECLWYDFEEKEEDYHVLACLEPRDIDDLVELSSKIRNAQQRRNDEMPRELTSLAPQSPQLPQSSRKATATEGSSEDKPSSTRNNNKAIKTSSRRSTGGEQQVDTSASNTSQVSEGMARFLALCVNTGAIHKTLAEMDTSNIKSDATAFSILKNQYLKTRGTRSLFNFLIEPVTVEFIQFTLWNLRGGYISVCDRPNCIPPDTCDDYEFSRPPVRHPPMPPEIFIHYLNHDEGDLNPIRNDWLPRRPKRKDRRVIDCGEACLGWGMHVIEGPNREVIFSIMMLTILASVLAAILWSTLRNDIQGGTGLGALIVAVPPAILTAFLFRLGGI